MRVHPAKPKVGIRTSKPNEMWHIDTTIIRLVDGTKAYLHAIIDNYSRRILSWRIGASFDTGNTVTVLLDACKSCETGTPTVLTDGGVENMNRNVDELIASVDRGVYVTRFHYVNVEEPVSVLLTGMTRDGTFMIEDGHLTAVLADFVPDGEPGGARAKNDGVFGGCHVDAPDSCRAEATQLYTRLNISEKT